MEVEPSITVACDESGNDGENLLGGSTPVFAHASVVLSEYQAAKIMHEVRTRTGNRSIELKSRTLLQKKHSDTARWLLEHPALANSVSLHLTHKRYMLVTKLFDATVEELAHDYGYDMYADGSALCGVNILFFMAPQLYGKQWDALLLALQNFFRAKTPDEANSTLGALDGQFAHVKTHPDLLPGILLNTAHQGLAHLRSLSKLQLGEGIDHRLRTLDPLLPAIGAAVKFWYDKSGRPVEILHDDAKELTPEQISVMRRSLAAPEIVAPHRAGQGVRLAGISLVDSKADERVQVADLLAGLARTAAEAMISGTEHPLLGLIEEHMSELSLWPRPELMDPERAKTVAQRP